MALELVDTLFGDCCCSGGGASAAALGDILCIEGDCSEGAAALQELQAFYAASGSPAQFRSAVDTLVRTYNEIDGRWSRHIPFSGACCEIKAVGNQAKALLGDIAKATRQAAPVPITPPSSSTEDAFKNVKDALSTAGQFAIYGALGLAALVAYQSFVRR